MVVVVVLVVLLLLLLLLLLPPLLCLNSGTINTHEHFEGNYIFY